MKEETFLLHFYIQDENEKENAGKNIYELNNHGGA